MTTESSGGRPHPIAASRPAFVSRLHDERVAAALGIALGVGFVVCFVTGVVSHLVQDPGTWFSWPARPAGLYRVTQSLHVATGIALIPILLAKLWVVYPRLFQRPVVRSTAHAVERALVLPLVGASVLLLFTGVANINIYRPWDFDFRAGHHAAAWIAMGALVVHVTAKWGTTIGALRPGQVAPPVVATTAAGAMDRRTFLSAVFATSGLLTVVTVGQTVAPLRSLALLAPRRPDVGPQGFPVNRTAASVGLADVDVDSYRLTVDGAVARPLSLSYDELLALPHHEATLPIQCVEGWSTVQRWRGVRLRDLLERAGARDGAEVTVVAMHRSSRLQTSDVDAHLAQDPDTLLALEVGGDALAPDHGFPVRLIAPNRPGVMQTKWIERVEVR